MDVITAYHLLQHLQRGVAAGAGSAYSGVRKRQQRGGLRLQRGFQRGGGVNHAMRGGYSTD